MPSDEHSQHETQDARRLRELAAVLRADPKSPDANRLIAELIVGWRRYYEPWLVTKFGRQIADPVVSNAELRLMRLLRRKQQFNNPWRSVVWHMVRKELASELRRLAKRGEKETAVPEVFGEDSSAVEPTTVVEADESSPEYDVARLRRTRARLSLADQEVLALLFDEDLSREAAAKKLGITVKTLNVRRFRALERLRKHWGEGQGEDV